MIAAIDTNRALGKNGAIPWHIPEDLKHFQQTTTSHPVIMGRKTWDSLPSAYKPLPNRTNIIVTRSHTNIEGATVSNSIEEALEIAKTSPGSEEIFIIGGGSIYKEALHLAERLYITCVDTKVENADTFFPDYTREFSKIISEKQSSNEKYSYTFKVLERD